MKKSQLPRELLIGVLFTLFIIGTAATLIIQFRPFYYMQISLLDLPGLSGFGREEILLNFNALMDYLIPFTGGELVFPTFPASREGIIHFQEVKVLFEAFALLIPLTGIPLFFLVRTERRRQRYHYLKTSSIVIVVLPALVGLACALNFELAFELFHKLFFRNDYYLFDPVSDPVINILPETVFFLYGMAIVIVTLLAALLLCLLYRRRRPDRKTAGFPEQG